MYVSYPWDLMQRHWLCVTLLIACRAFWLNLYGVQPFFSQPRPLRCGNQNEELPITYIVFRVQSFAAHACTHAYTSPGLLVLPCTLEATCNINTDTACDRLHWCHQCLGSSFTDALRYWLPSLCAASSTGCLSLHSELCKSLSYCSVVSDYMKRDSLVI
ncbi:hypothetical protein ARMGADRAFT_800924 [Armillaria gallica]|uniref:Uncharacterized protein n=1 Tax=Armillaria gallica TaxID=47427 RepID=A0A2H3E2B6_ARMGA|nr:hypothetical protein ARMGADRAFT_800924 [Armillaria gallica]